MDLQWCMAQDGIIALGMEPPIMPDLVPGDSACIIHHGPVGACPSVILPDHGALVSVDLLMPMVVDGLDHPCITPTIIILHDITVQHAAIMVHVPEQQRADPDMPVVEYHRITTAHDKTSTTDQVVTVVSLPECLAGQIAETMEEGPAA